MRNTGMDRTSLDQNVLVVLSGGQDSTTCLGWALAQGNGAVHCVTFDYGQRHGIELQAACRIVDHFRSATGRNIGHEIIRVGEGILHSTSPLTSDNALETYNDHASMEKIIGDRVEKTFVPMRNQLFLTIAANRAVELSCLHIITGVCGEDNANYPDCTPMFIETTERAINAALGTHAETWISINAPLLHKTKAESVHMALLLPHTYDALALSHTAYDGKYPPNGSDHASILRAHGFEKAGVPDPLVVRAWLEGEMDFPQTGNYAQLHAVAIRAVKRDRNGTKIGFAARSPVPAK